MFFAEMFICNRDNLKSTPLSTHHCDTHTPTVELGSHMVIKNSVTDNS